MKQHHQIENPYQAMDAQMTNTEAEIVSEIVSIPKTMPSGKGDGEWTKAIKRSLITLGKNKGYNICTSGFPEECEREWLFDLVWYRNDPPEHLREIGLIVESEWSFDLAYVKFDFEKLLIAKSPLKVMIFQDLKDNSTQICSLLETGIRSFQTEPANEKYILACYQNAKDVFAIKTITVC
jgi:hypothetical protein